MKSGDNVRLAGIPADVNDDAGEGLQTRTLFEKCPGKVFRVEEVERPEGLDIALAGLPVGHVPGAKPYMYTIWVEAEYLEIVTRN